MNGVLVVDKAAGPTSHDVVRFARRALETRRVGHTGTLDPFATGVLVLAVGEGTKLVSALTVSEKAYEGYIVLGAETDTLDPDGPVVAQAPVPQGLTVASVQDATAAFVGTIRQRPPAASAVHVAGARSYERFRRGERVEPEARDVVVHEITVVAVADGRVSFRVRSGKGFYVRAFARDLAKALGTVGHLGHLRRTASGPFRVDDAVKLDRLFAAKSGDLDAKEEVLGAVRTLDAAWGDRPRVVITPEALQRVTDGKPIFVTHVDRQTLPAVAQDEIIGMFCVSRRMIGLATRAGEELRVVRGIRETLAPVINLVAVLCLALGCSGGDDVAVDATDDAIVEAVPEVSRDVAAEPTPQCEPTCDSMTLCCGTAAGGATCVDPDTDLSHCGDCGIDCAMGRGFSCRMGRCVCGTSPGGCEGNQRSMCCRVNADGGSAFCANLDSDGDHCGGCGTPCNPAQADRCSGGSCRCGSRRALCSGTGADRCCPKAVGEGECVDTTSDALNCGECGRQCQLSETCRAGVCESS